MKYIFTFIANVNVVRGTARSLNAKGSGKVDGNGLQLTPQPSA